MAYRPDGMQNAISHLVVSNANAALDQYKTALDAADVMILNVPGTDKVMHATFSIGDTKVFICDENPDMGMLAPQKGTVGARFYVYVEDVDAAYKQARGAGMADKAAPQDMFWGDRTAVVSDEFGINWTLATKNRDVSPEDMIKAMESMGQ